MPATSGRVLSKVCITPEKPPLGAISGRRGGSPWGRGSPVSTKLAVSEARMPSLCSSRSSLSPGLSRSTTKLLIAARPCLRSSVAHTTISSARSPEVTKIFSPLRMYSPVVSSSLAVVRIAAESEPASGSVMAIAAHLPPKRSSCSSLATAAIAAWPRPWRGMASSRPTSPQHISIRPTRLAMLVPLRFPPSPLRVADDEPLVPTAPAPAPLRPPPSLRPSMARRACRAPWGTRARACRTCASWGAGSRWPPGGPARSAG